MRYFEHPVNLPREQAFEGKYVIQTEEQNLSPVDAVVLYKSLSQVLPSKLCDGRPVALYDSHHALARLCHRAMTIADCSVSFNPLMAITN